MDKTINYLSRSSFQRLLDQWPETEYLASWDTTIQMLDANLRLIGSITLHDQAEPKGFPVERREGN